MRRITAMTPTSSSRRRRSPLLFVLLAAVTTALSLGLVELALRLLWTPPPPLGRLSYATQDGTPVADLGDAARLGFVTPVPPDQTPRPRFMFAADKQFFLCYADAERLGADWLDAQGRVPVRINAYNLRERAEIKPEKPPGERRIVCIGDSFTFCWGVPEERGWVRMLEDRLRKDGQNLRTVNCGAAGAICVDEYEWGLRHRFGKFAPDVVLVTICLNDLIPSSGLFVQGPSPKTGLRSLDLLLGALGRDPLDLDPKVDWVGLLYDLPQDGAGQLYGPDKPYDAMWARGTPQRALLAMQAWCKEHNCKLGIVLWPFLQGLGPGRAYPFSTLHADVSKFCSENHLDFLDVLPALAQTPAEALWVTPADMHANPTAQMLALERIEPFVRRLLTP
ncbi:MAG: hypothetical protein RL398_828 [Planctomycetota bacterium]|jgi:hypothetical protein